MVRRMLGHRVVSIAGAALGYLAVVGVALAVTISAVDRLTGAWLRDAGGLVSAGKPATLATVKANAAATSPSNVVVRTAAMIPTNDDWADKLRDPGFWAKNKAGAKSSSGSSSKAPPSGRSNLGGAVSKSESGSSWSGSKDNASRTSSRSDESDGEETYRTVCVRLCDGAFYPISFSTTREHFEADAAKCEKTCAGGRLYVHRNPGSELDELEDLKGQPYKKLTTAFLFRTSYDASCKCRAHPWEDVSRALHRVYALEEAKAAGNKTAASELTRLTASMKKAEADAAAERKRVELERFAEAKRLADEKTRKADEKRREAEAQKALKAAEEKAAKAAKAAELKAAKDAKQAALKAERQAAKDAKLAAKLAADASAKETIKGRAAADASPTVVEPKTQAAAPVVSLPAGAMSLGGPGMRGP